MTTKITDANIDSDKQDNNAFNISLLGFKMAVNEGLTVFNLVDGVVDEFNDESGIDEAENTNDYYCASSDFYTNNCSTVNYSGGFASTSVTEPDTSSAQTACINAQTSPYGATIATYTVPCGMTSANLYVWAAGGGSREPGDYGCNAVGGPGGYSQGTLAVTGGQVLNVVTGFGGRGANVPAASGTFLGGGVGRHEPSNDHSASGGGLSGVFGPQMANAPDPGTAPYIMMIAGAGGGGGHGASTPGSRWGGAGGGLKGNQGGTTSEQTSAGCKNGGGGEQSVGGQGASSPTGTGQTGSFLKGGDAVSSPSPYGGGSGGGGYYGGGAAGNGPGPIGAGGGGSSYFGHPQISCGSTEEGPGSPDTYKSGGSGSPFYPTATCSVAEVGDGGNGSNYAAGEPGFVLITGTVNAFASPGGGSSTIISSAFSSTSVPTSSRIVVFEENVDTPTLNTDIIASVSRDGGTTFTNATLSDSGYVTGSSGQRILTGQADISGQPSGQSMRWKLALANNTVKIHGVSLQWS